MLPALLGGPIDLLLGTFLIESFRDDLPIVGADLAEWYEGYVMMRKRRLS